MSFTTTDAFTKGDQNFNNNFNIGKKAPIDSRMRGNNILALTNSDIPFKYKGMVMSIKEDENRSGGSADNNGVWFLKNDPASDNTTDIDDWEKIGSGSGITVVSSIDDGGVDPVDGDTLFHEFAGKQDTLTFDPPSSDNSNPSTSSQIKSALDLKLNLSGGSLTGNTTLGTQGSYITLSQNSVVKTGSADFSVGTVNNQSLLFKTNNAIRMGINSTGNASIGVSPDTNYRLNIGGNLNVTGTYFKDGSPLAYTDLTGTPTIPTVTSQLTNDAGYLTSIITTTGVGTGTDRTDTTTQLLIKDDESVSPQFLKIGVNSSNNYSYIQSTQSTIGHKPLLLQPLGANVGIGTTNPSSALHLNEGNFKVTSNTGGKGVILEGTSANASWALLPSSGTTKMFRIHDIDNGSSRLSINGTGDVGIGLAPSSSYKLNVDGDINFTGNLYKDGDAFSGGSGGTVDTDMSTTSTNPVQNSTIQTALNTKLNLSGGTLTGNVSFGNVTTYGISSVQRAIYFHNTSTNYAIFRAAGAWEANDYPPLVVKFITGLVLDGGSNANWTNAYVKVNGKMGVNVTSKPTSQFEVNGTAEATKLIVNSSDSDAITIQHPTLSADFLTISSATIRCDGGSTSGKNMKIINSIDTNMEFRVGQTEKLAMKISGSDDSVEICNDTTGDVSICGGGGDILIGSNGTNLETELNKLSSSTGLGDCLSSSYLSLSTDTQNMFDGVEDFTWSGSGDDVSIDDTGSTTMDFVCLKRGFYSIDVFLRCSDGTLNERSRVYGFILIMNSSGTEISRGYLGESYYRDDATNIDDCIIAGSVVKYLTVGDKWRVRTQRTDKQRNSGTIKPDQSTSKLYCQYMGCGIVQ